jgi:hypothetical protein
MILTGDKNKFALECLLSEDDQTKGVISIFIGNTSFSSNVDCFELDVFFDNTLKQLETFDHIIPELYELSYIEIFKSLDCIWNDGSSTECVIDKVIRGFFDEPCDVISKIVFYGGYYAFDGITIVLISNGTQSKLMVRDQKTLRGSEVVIEYKEFRERFNELQKIYNEYISDKK